MPFKALALTVGSSTEKFFDDGNTVQLPAVTVTGFSTRVPKAGEGPVKFEFVSKTAAD